MAPRTVCDAEPPTHAQVLLERVYCGSRSTVALSTKGNVYAWGHNHFGQLGTPHAATPPHSHP